jgi:SagB-type dehydrogenase family enzyme
MTHPRNIGLAALAGLALVAAGAAPPAGGDRRRVEAESVALPPPATRGSVSLEEALARRRSIREFAPTPLTRAELSQLLWAAQGLTGPGGHRTAPSAGALYPIELYVATPDGLFRYVPEGHRIARRADHDVRDALRRAALGQESVGEAPAVFVITALPARTEVKYGPSRTPRYLAMEAGHIAQNILLEATALDLGGVPAGAFDDEKLADALGLPSGQVALYLIPVGHGRTH